MLAHASAQGYDISGKRTPYHGYYYRMLKHPGCFAFLAYPAEYRSSGVMTFVVTRSGVIHEKISEKRPPISLNRSTSTRLTTPGKWSNKLDRAF
jgi:hypothetical protein